MNLTLDINKVYTFKLNSGEELIAKVTDTDSQWITIDSPVSVAPGPQGMGLIPSMFTADPSESCKLNISSVAFCAKTDEAVRTKYIEATTGIKLPEKKLILG